MPQSSVLEPSCALVSGLPTNALGTESVSETPGRQGSSLGTFAQSMSRSKGKEAVSAAEVALRPLQELIQRHPKGMELPFVAL